MSFFYFSIQNKLSFVNVFILYFYAFLDVAPSKICSLFVTEFKFSKIFYNKHELENKC